MRDDINISVYSGRLIAEPNLRRIPESDTAVCDLTIISNRTVPNKKRVAVVVRATTWGRQAEFLGANLSRGDEVMVTGALTDDNFELEKGNPESKTTGRVKIDDCNIVIMRRKLDDRAVGDDELE